MKIEIGKDSHGAPVMGTLAVDPSGHLVTLQPGVELKDGWRDATPGDVDAAKKAEAGRKNPEPAVSEGGPVKAAAETKPAQAAK